MITSRTKQFVAIALLYFVGSVGVAVYVVNRTVVAGNKLEQRMELVGKSQLRQERYDDLLHILDRSADERERLGKYLLTDGTTVRFLTETEALAQKMGLSLVTDSLTVKGMPNPDFKTIEVNLRAKGSKDLVEQFLELIETLPYYSSLNSLIFTSAGAGSDSWEARITLVVGLHAYDQ